MYNEFINAVTQRPLVKKVLPLSDITGEEQKRVNYLYEPDAEEVLKALLPEQGTDIKGNIQSQAKLLEVCGYRHRPRDFEDLLRILDSEVRLITPTQAPEAREPGGQGEIFMHREYNHCGALVFVRRSCPVMISSSWEPPPEGWRL